jgi:hypothetical protein
MHRDSRFGTQLIWALFLALLAARLSGAHVHLCFDGLEPPATMHVQNHAGQHHADQTGGSHNDVDLSAVAEALVKKAGDMGGLDLLPLLAAAVLLLIAPQFTRIFLPQARRVALPSFPAFFLPLAHAPPR